jgi:4-hydroxy-2-oxoheptanedioate aldolase
MVTSARSNARPANARSARKKATREIAFWLETPNLYACEIAALAGYGTVIFDFEHGVMPRAEADRLALACKGLGLRVYGRVARAGRVEIQHALDSGVDGVILPQIADLDHAREACAFAKYPPLGTRGVGYSRTMAYAGVDSGFFGSENRRIACFAMIETPGALASVEAIARLDTLDGLFIGPADLSMTRGRGAFRMRAADFADFAKVARAAARARKGWGIPAPSAKVFDFARRNGATLVTVSDDLTALRIGFAQGLAVTGKG